MRGPRKSLACESCVNFPFGLFSSWRFSSCYAFRGSLSQRVSSSRLFGAFSLLAFSLARFAFPKNFWAWIFALRQRGCHVLWAWLFARLLSLCFCFSGVLSQPDSRLFTQTENSLNLNFSAASKSWQKRLIPAQTLPLARAMAAAAQNFQNNTRQTNVCSLFAAARSNVCSKPSECPSPSGNNQVRGCLFD